VTRIPKKAIKKWFFKLIRPLFVRNVDSNEDFSCGHCGEPVLKRFLFCSDYCTEASGFMRMPEESD
jgi:hypothetical protein